MEYSHRTIRFATTEDGVDIAFWEIGDGKPVVILNLFSISHAELEWTVPTLASLYAEMAHHYRVIRFDPRGAGLSGEPPGGWGATTDSGAQQGLSTHEMGLDISAVASAMDLKSFALVAVGSQGPVAIEYAATHPEVSELILCDTFAKASESWIAPALKAEMAFSRIENNAGPSFTIWERAGPPEEAEALVNLARVARGRDKRQAIAESAQFEWDADAMLPNIAIPTLILTNRNTALADTLPDGRHLAATISGSELVGLEAEYPGPSPYYTKRMATLTAIHAVLTPEMDFAPASLELRSGAASGFRTIVFTDVVGSTDFMRQVGDEQGRAAIRRLEHLIAELAAELQGHVVKNLGDGSLVSFGSNSSAIIFALRLQDESSEGPLEIRVGMSAGEPIEEDGDIHGTVVAHASRIGDLGDAGEVVVSDTVRQLAAGKGFAFEPRGDVTLKGFDESERIWTVTRP